MNKWILKMHAHQFRETSIFPLQTIENLTARSSEYLSSAKFVKLLEHLHIIAPIEDASGKAEKYFIPSVLTHVAHKANICGRASRKFQHSITFRCGYCSLQRTNSPPDVKAQQWLKEKEVSQDQV